MNEKRAVLLGATGLIGGFLCNLLLEDGWYELVTVLARRQIPGVHPRISHHIVDFDRLEDFRKLFAADDVFCCLGTTMAKAKTREMFRRVDYEYPVDAARIAREMGARRYFLVSSIGADPRSRMFYTRVKGEVERDIAGLGFEAVHIFRPSFLLGERTERRPGEDFIKRLAPFMSLFMRGPLRNYAPLRAESVARAMVRAVHDRSAGVFIHKSDEIMRNGNGEKVIRG
jgi:uncharacterized protein YbjT (DUF2867 family)